MANWKTTIPGVLAGLAQAAKAAFPEYGIIADLATGLFLALLGIFAKQVAKPK